MCANLVKRAHSRYAVREGAVHVACRPLSPIDETTARIQPQADTGHGVDTGLGTGTEQVADVASGLYVFYDDPSDFGGVAVVSARTSAPKARSTTTRCAR